jgi:type I restriction enzyme S subunit
MIGKSDQPKTHWKEKKLEQVIESNCIGLVKAAREQDVSCDYIYIKMNNISNNCGFNLKKVSNVNASEEEVVKYRLNDKDFLFNTRNSIELVGKNCLYRTISDSPVLFNNNIMRIRFNDEIIAEFASYAFQNIDVVEQLELMKQGTTNVAAIYYKSLKNLKIKYPPVYVQKKIVAKLDLIFADIEKAKVNAEQNLNNSKELFESYLQGIFSHSQEGWAESSLQKITSKIGSGATPRGGKAAYKEQGMSLIRSMNVHDRRFKEKNLALIDDEQAGKLNNVTLEKDDVLLNITGASVARCCVVPDEYLPARVNQHVSIIRVDTDIISPRFMCFLLTSTYYKNILLEVGGSGSTREAITKVQLQNFVITYPDTVEKQEEFLDELTGIESQSLELQNIYTKKIHALDELKQSILQKAFNGELA